MVVLLAVVLLVLFEGSSVRTAGEEMDPGFQRDVVLAVGKPTGWVADRLPFDEWADDALAFLEDDGVGDEGGFDSHAERGAAAASRRSPRTRSTRRSWAPSPSRRASSTRCW